MKYALLGLYIASYGSGFASMAMSFVVWRNTRERGFILFFVNLIAFLLRVLAINVVFFLRSFLGIENFQDSFAYFASVMVITAFFNASMVLGAHGLLARQYARLREAALLLCSQVPLGLLLFELLRRLLGEAAPRALWLESRIAMESTSILFFYCILFFFLNLKKVDNPSYRIFMKASIALACAMIPMFVLQVLVNNSATSSISPLSVADNVYYFSINLVVIFALGKHYLLTPIKEPAWIAATYDIKKSADLELTERECEVVELLGQGLANKQIADKLCISPATVKNHIYNVYQKTGAKSRVELLNTLR